MGSGVGRSDPGLGLADRVFDSLARSDQQGQGAASTLTGQMNLAGQTAPGASESLAGAVLPGRASFLTPTVHAVHLDREIPAAVSRIFRQPWAAKP